MLAGLQVTQPDTYIMSSELERLRQQLRLWTLRRTALESRHVLPTGYASLDAALPGGGWPRNALTELLVGDCGRGELSLLLPALIALAAEKDSQGALRWLCWVAPPCIPYAPALAAHGLSLERLLLVHPRRHRQRADSLWAAEQALSCGQCAAVLVWTRRPAMVALRRLQLAAEASSAWVVALRPAAEAAERSPAALRLSLHAGGWVRLLKCRGGAPAEVFLGDAWRSQTQC